MDDDWITVHEDPGGEKEEEKNIWKSTDPVIARRENAEIVSVRISDSYCTRNTDIIALSIRGPNAAGTA